MLVLPLSACGDDGGSDGSETEGPGEQSTSASPEPTLTVSGTLEVDALGSVIIKRNPDRCVARGDLAQHLKVGEDPFVISDPSGRQIATAEITAGEGQTYVDKDDGQTYYSPGFCDFTFSSLTDAPIESGVYTIAIPELDIEERFEASTANVLTIKYRVDARLW